MKKFMKIMMGFMVASLISINYIYAECNDEDLNEWSTKVEAVFTENTVMNSNISKYAYFLSIKPYREDIRIVVTDGRGGKGNGQFFEEVNLYGVGAFTNLEEETYTIDVYGAKGSKCEGDLLKKLTYTVPRFNRKVKDARCVGNSDIELCKTFTNSTKDMTEEEFNKEINKYVKEKGKTVGDVLSAIISYGLFIVLPILVVGIIYIRKIRKVKREERDR